ncbi:hypothetical protein [Natranaerofaba carboxydovora]|uniref:hypothetical protein n=1 Tax=Natranaerofaba carboxydovora TaxID=2742683 RepID=UPI001F139BED|nr:hypothetical protein [Natranaerofaba carboxydovora]UMZ74351.1 FMN-binding domain protein [Natranaerofaba carboxydovora]
MFKKGILILLAVLVAATFIVGCEPDDIDIDEEKEEEKEELPEEAVEEDMLDWQAIENKSFEDGTYRGIFEDGGEMQVNVQFTLEDNVVTDASYRHLAYGGEEYDVEDDGVTGDVAEQYEQLLEHLEGEDIREGISDLYDADGIVEDYDSVTGATLRANKTLSAMVDGLNRGAYSFEDEAPEGYSPIKGESFEDGTYRGIFSDGGDMQVNVQFTLEDNVVTDASYRHLYYGGEEYDVDDDGVTGDVAEQYEQLLDYLEGEDIRDAVADLYDADGIVEDYDSVTGATLRANKTLSAVVDGLNRGLYRDDEISEGYSPAGLSFEDGTYRGVFADGGEMQVNVQFTLEDNVVTDASYRHLAYGGEEYDVEDDGAVGDVAEQYEQLLEYLEGEDIRDSIADLYDADGIVEDYDTVTGATLRANKTISAFVDGLNRGAYRFENGVPEGYSPLNLSFEDGTYRGIFEDGGEMQVNVQFTLEDNVVTDAGYRHLAYGGEEYDEEDDGALGDVAAQYEQLLEYLEGEDIRTNLADLYDADGIVEDYDTVTGATLRANKTISAFKDGLNRGLYRDDEIAAGYSPVVGMSFEDGTYRGIFNDGGEMQVNVQFTLEDNVITDFSYRHLAYGGEEYDVDDDGALGDVARQYEQLGEHLEGEDVRAKLADLYDADGIVEDYDTVTGATLRANKTLSAIKDGLNRGIYSEDEIAAGYSPVGIGFEDGTYRGIFSDGGDMQVNVQFTLEDNVVTDAGYRHLYYGGEEYDVDDDGVTGDVAEQYEQLLEYLEGEDIRVTLVDLYDADGIVEDYDTVTGATLRSNKTISSIVDGINRGVYRE